MSDNIEKMLENRTELLQSLQNKQEAINMMLTGINLVIQGGEEGLLELIQMDGGPQIVIATMNGLVDVVQLQQKESIEYAEGWFGAQDALIHITEMLNNDPTE